MEYSAMYMRGLAATGGLEGMPAHVSRCSSTRSTPHTSRLVLRTGPPPIRQFTSIRRGPREVYFSSTWNTPCTPTTTFSFQLHQAGHQAVLVSADQLCKTSPRIHDAMQSRSACLLISCMPSAQHMLTRTDQELVRYSISGFELQLTAANGMHVFQPLFLLTLSCSMRQIKDCLH